MPLKHSTETFLVIALAVVIALTGFAIALLPPLVISVWPWTIAFVLSLFYPLALYPLLKSRRADYAFRLLHLFPALLLLVWLALELLRQTADSIGHLQDSYVFAWTLGAVALGYLALFLFCLDVIRQRLRRGIVLAALFIPFAALALTAQGYGITRRLQGVVASVFITAPDEIVAHMEPSDDPEEELWRMRLRRQARREERLADRTDADRQSSLDATESLAEQSRSESSMLISTMSDAASSDASPLALLPVPDDRVAVEPPPVLSNTGAEPAVLALFLLAGYCTVVQARAMKRER